MHNSTDFSDHSQLADVKAEGDATIEAFRWLLIFGFPASMAAARLMPELFSDVIDDAVELARRVTRNPFGHTA